MNSLFMNVFLIFMFLLVVTLLIVIILICKRTVLPKCPNFIITVLKKLEMKLMFNSILRSLLETYMLMSVSTFRELYS